MLDARTSSWIKQIGEVAVPASTPAISEIEVENDPAVVTAADCEKGGEVAVPASTPAISEIEVENDPAGVTAADCEKGGEVATPASTPAISNVLFSEGEEFVGNDSTPVINNSTVQDVTSLTTANNCYNIVFCNEFHEFENYVPTAVNLGDLTYDVACEAGERVTMVPENIVASLQTESEVLDDQAVEMAADQPVEMASANCVLVHVVSNGNTQVYPIMASVVHGDGTLEYTLPESDATGLLSYDNSFNTTQNAGHISKSSLQVSAVDTVSVEPGVSGSLDAIQHDTSDTEVRPKKCRKRQINKHSWKCNIRKLNRNKGVEYVNKQGKRVGAKIFNPCFGHCCNKKKVECQNVSVEDRKQIFEGFWNLADYNLQQAYICGCVSQRQATTHTVVRNQMSCQNLASDSASTEPPASSQAIQNEQGAGPNATNVCSESATARICPKSRAHKKRHYKNFTRTFSFNTSEGIQVVCKELFLKTLQVSQGRVERALSAQRTNGGLTQVDKRGKHVKKAVD